jgi:urease accessory protein
MRVATTIMTTMMKTTLMHSQGATLRLLAWLSPAFPTGAYAYSHGIEWAVESGDITDGVSLRHWLEDVLTEGSGRNDAILLRHAFRAGDDAAALQSVADIAAGTAGCLERRLETVNQGSAFVAASRSWNSGDLPGVGEMAYPVAVGALAARHGLDETTVTAGYLQAIAANFISAAVRLVPLGQSTGLRVLAELEPVILAVLDATAEASLDDLGGACFRSDIAAMRHETQYTRLFRT